MAEPNKSRRWFRYSLRTMFAVVTAVAVWLGYYAHWMRERRQAEEWIESHRPDGFLNVLYPRPEVRFPWMLRIMGEQPRDSIFVDVDSEEDTLQVEKLKTLFPEAHVRAFRKYDLDPL